MGIVGKSDYEEYSELMASSRFLFRNPKEMSFEEFLEKKLSIPETTDEQKRIDHEALLNADNPE